MSADIIKIISRPKRDDVQTDFPAIAFQSARREPAIDPVDVARDECTGSANRET
ncbi:hypothetical protein [Bradyrhizobium sp.]|uniref:hypothetical protein n=1 Tax=Bradyrhizobium sp. TaxID=376 RepID=UPI002C4CE8CD|nr:hypothetical protein [Bradyrhizobium sp.]HMM88376.1 hypothetical protein [Bradyrhizobium sp.]